MKQLIYRSKPVSFNDGILGEILLTAWANNRQDHISGALICRHDLYLQLIEGPEDKVDALYAKICGDDRHTDVKTLVDVRVYERILSAWSMLDERTLTDKQSVLGISVETVDKASSAQLLSKFERIAAEAGKLEKG